MTCIAAQIIGAKEFWQRKHGNMGDVWTKYNIKVSNENTCNVCGYLGLHEVSVAPHRGGGGEQPATQQQPPRHHQLHPQ